VKKLLLYLFLFGIFVCSGELIERHYVDRDGIFVTILVFKTLENIEFVKLQGLWYFPLNKTFTIEKAGFWTGVSDEYPCSGYKFIQEEK
jgi:hypothetical protein